MVYIVIRSRDFFSAQHDEVVAVCKTRERAIIEAGVDMSLCDVPAYTMAILVSHLEEGADYAGRWRIIAEDLKG